MTVSFEEAGCKGLYPVCCAVYKQAEINKDTSQEGAFKLISRRPFPLSSLILEQNSQYGLVLFLNLESDVTDNIKVKVLIQSAEKGDDSLEDVYDWQLQGGLGLKLLYSPALYLLLDPKYMSPLGFKFAAVPNNTETNPANLENMVNAVENELEILDSFSEHSMVDIDRFLKANLLAKLELDSKSTKLLGPLDFCSIEAIQGLCQQDFLLLSKEGFPFFYSPTFIKGYLEAWTGLKLGIPTQQMRLWSLTTGSYRLLNSKHGDRDYGLDLYVCLVGHEALPAADPEDLSSMPGSVLYVSDETGEVVGAVAPVTNRLFLAYRSEGSSRFIRYIPISRPQDALSLPKDNKIVYLTLTYPVLDEETKDETIEA